MFKCIDNSIITISGINQSNIRVEGSNPTEQVHLWSHCKMYNGKGAVMKVTKILQLNRVEFNIIK
jgi:hypothetical protein